jgi:phage terminase large subunit
VQPSAKIEFPEKLECLFRPGRYKVLYGGRGGAKSWGIARALLALGTSKRLRVLCAREIQKSITDSVHRLLADQVAAMGLGGFYEIQQSTIKSANGTLFFFAGLRHNINNIKSVEGADIVWVEEAQTVSKSSWDTLIPTIRKPGSQIVISFNPELDTDETYKRFVLTPPPDSEVVRIGWQDNPWFPEVLKQERETMKARDPDGYLTIWEGHCRQTLDGAIYAKEIRAATDGARITRVPYEPNKPVHTFWDLGRADKTSIWFAQIVGFEFRVIDFYENRGEVLPHYMKELQGRPYVYGDHWLPHDANNELLASERTIAQQMRAAGFTVRITPKTSVANGINAARTLFANVWFDAEKCADGLNALRRYRYDVDAESGQFSDKPLHDDASHAADAFRYLAVSLREKKASQMPKAIARPAVHGASAWLA